MHNITDIEVKLTIFPDANINAVVFGSLIRIITAAKRCFTKKELLKQRQSTLLEENKI